MTRAEIQRSLLTAIAKEPRIYLAKPSAAPKNTAAKSGSTRGTDGTLNVRK